MEFQGLVKHLGDFIQKNSPTILTTLGAVGVFTTAVLAAKATIAACREENVGWGPRDVSDLEVVKNNWKLYIPALSVGAVSVVCIIGANSISTRRTAAIASAYSLVEKAASEYQRKVVEIIGEKKEKDVRDAISKDHVDRSPVQSAQVIITGRGDQLCLDRPSGRYFKSDVESLRQAENDLNQELINDSWLCLNDLYAKLGLPSIELGDDVGWVPDNLIHFEFSSALSADNVPCIVLNYKYDPKYIVNRW